VRSQTVDGQVLRQHLAAMYRIRFFEEEVKHLRSDGAAAGSIHLCNGQEAIYVGACAALDLTKDAIFPTYRGHGWALACGAPLEAMFGELLGRQTGVNGGRGGSAYLSAPAYGMYGENSIVGGGVPIATGAALAATFDGSGRIALAAFGDGAVNQGSVHESMNFAATRKLPVLFLIENNLYSELSPTSAMVPSDRLYKRGSAYGIPGVRIDGNDVEKVRASVAEAAKRARAGQGPVLIEAMTERIVGHYIGDAETYRPSGEVDRAVDREPIKRLSDELRAGGVSDDELRTIEEHARAECIEARDRALAAPPADPNTVLEHLYA
jgi:TPP-dependent pyruvate/acetoin dehydrogenase alpha subunit